MSEVMEGYEEWRKRALAAERKLVERSLSEYGQKEPWVVCLCGSTRFKDAYISENARLTLEGKIVLSVGLFAGSGDAVNEEQKQMLDVLHLRKIDLAHEVRILNVAGYVGESTLREIDYATRSGKLVSFLEEVVA